MIRVMTILLLVSLAGPTRAAEKPARPLEALTVLLQTADDPAVQRDVLRGMADALAGRRTMAAPKGWSEVYRKLSNSGDAEVRGRVTALSLLFGDPQALASLLKVADDPRADANRRREALELLLDKRADGVPALLRRLLDDGAMRASAIRGLARYDEPDTAKLLLARYAKLTREERLAAAGTLASRPASALALLDAVEKKRVPRDDVSPFLARQMAALKDKRVAERLNSVWGSIRPTPKDRQDLLAKYRKLGTPEELKKANRGKGRVVWEKNCATCHTLFGEGKKIGPDLTGSQRANPEYVLGKILDPSAVVPREYQVTRLELNSGRVITGLVKQEMERVLLVQTPTEEVRVLKSDIAERNQQQMSLMPEGLLNPLKDAEVRDLLGYLAGKDQVPVPGPAEGKKGG